MRWQLLIIILLFLASGIFWYQITGKVSYETISINVTRVVDGDTIDSDLGKIRLLGINTPEKNQPFYQEAKNFLVQFQGKQIQLQEFEKDKYDRTLGYLFYNNKLLNAEILKNGLANLYVYNQDEHYSELKNAEKYARDNELGIWKKSINSGCIKVVKFQPIDNEYENETLILENICSINLNIIIKDNANHIYDEKINSNSQINLTFKDIFNDDGDSLYIRDNSGLLLFYRY